MTLAELLVELRTARGLSQEDVAARTGVSARAIGDLERGATRRPHRETVRALADGLGLDPSERQAFEQAARSAPPASTRPRKGPRPALPAPVTSIVGRDDDVAALSRLVRSPAVRLATVTGPGGVGKSRLAIEVGWRVGPSFDRVNAVDLSPLTRADDVPLAVASALGCRTAGLRPADAVAAAVGDARWLLVLESFEHVAGAAGTLGALLASCPRLTALVTSRAPLLLRGEHVWPLAPLRCRPAMLPTSRSWRPIRPSRSWCSGRPRYGTASDCTTRTRPPWHACAGGSTGCRWPSSWPPPTCGPRSRRSSSSSSNTVWPASTRSVSTCRTGTRRCGAPSSGAPGVSLRPSAFCWVSSACSPVARRRLTSRRYWAGSGCRRPRPASSASTCRSRCSRRTAW